MAITIEPFNPAWREEFRSLEQILLRALDEFRGRFQIHHVGSTAVEGLWSKPVLDIDIVIEDENLLNNIEEVLTRLGYEPCGDLGISGRFMFRQPVSSVPLTQTGRQWQDHHLYVCFAGSLAFANHINFRDLLKESPLLREEYSLLKKTLSGISGLSRDQYTLMKTDFIVSALVKCGMTPDDLKSIRESNSK